MKKIALWDKEERFCQRLTDGLNQEYPGKYSFFTAPALEVFLEEWTRFQPDLLMVPKELSERVLTEDLPFPPKKLLLSDFVSEETDLKSSPVILCKYKTLAEWDELLTKVFEVKKGVAPEPVSEKEGKLCLFTSGAGGVGTTTAAVAFAFRCRRSGKKVVFLSLQPFNSTALFFNGAVQFHANDVLSALRGGRYELSGVLKGALVRDSTGVRYLPASPVPTDLFQLTGEEIMELVEGIRAMGFFDYIILDLPPDGNESLVLPFLAAKKMVLLSDGTGTGNTKLKQLLEALPVMCNLSHKETEEKCTVLYNRFPKEQGELFDGEEQGRQLARLGGVHVLHTSGERKLARMMAGLAPFRKLEEELDHV